MTPRVLLVTTDFPPMSGGIQLLLSELVKHAAWDCTVVCFDDGDGGAKTVGPARTIRVPRARDHRLSVLRLSAATARVAHARRPDLVLSGHVVLGPASLAASRAVGCPTVQYVYAKELGGRPRVARAVLPRMDATIAISDYTRGLAVAAGADPRSVHLVLPGGGDGSARRPPSVGPREPTVVTVARLEDRYKGFDVVMRAMPLVRARVPDATWTVVGGGSLRSELEATAASWGMQDYVRFTGPVDDATRDTTLAQASVFVMPSRVPPGRGEGEGFGIVYLESGAAGLPVVAANEGGATSAVIDGVTGLLCDPRDHVAVADRIIRLLEDPALAQRLGEAGRARQKELSWERMAREVDAIVQELIAR